MKNVKHPFRCEKCRWRSKKRELKVNPIVGMKLIRRRPVLNDRQYVCNTRNSKRYLTNDEIKFIDWIGCYSCNHKDYAPGFTGLRIHCVHLIEPVQEEGKGFQCAIGNISCPGVCNVGRLYSPCEEFKEYDTLSSKRQIEDGCIKTIKKGAIKSLETIHIKPISKKVIKAKVVGIKKGTIKHFDNTIVV